MSQTSDRVVPDPKYMFRPLIETPLNKVKVAIIGQEPSPTMETDGLAYSFPRVIHERASMPQTLENIFEEYCHDLDAPFPKAGVLTPWARKGVLLWNEIPTTKASYPRAHIDYGWRDLTREIIETLYLNDKDTVFMFWTPTFKHWIEEMPSDAKIVDCGSPHVGYVHSGFFASSPFSKANAMLKAAGKDAVNWRLP